LALHAGAGADGCGTDDAEAADDGGEECDERAGSHAVDGTPAGLAGDEEDLWVWGEPCT
jgi:hypothetical protein